jgi:hypothetical protein
MMKKFPFTLLRDSRDDGLSLVEVIVAIALIMIVATSSAALSIQAIAASAGQERRQIAVTVANSALEQMAAQPVAGLYNGRTQAKVNTAFVASSGVNGVAKTYQGWDATATTLSVPDLPISQTLPIQSGTIYTVKTLIGPCFQLTSGGDCGLVTGYPASGATVGGPATAPSGSSALIRVIVIVTWTAGGTCSVTACSYAVSTLIDPHADLAWISHG